MRSETDTDVVQVKYSKQVFLLLLASPLTAFAHGEDVLVTVFLEFMVFVAFVIGLLTVKLNWKGKTILGAIYLFAVVLTFIATNKLPYREYQTIINVVIVAVPLAISAIGYFSLKVRFQKT